MAKSNKGEMVTNARRHTFKSFRDRIDSIKIDPNLKLSKRAYDYAESSFFAASFDHWKEVNLSQNFTEFVFEVEAYTQNLAQIIHHQDRIYKSLYSSIEKSDANSLQPLLEILAQFIHDLGEDFLPFYDNCLKLLLNVALNISSDVSDNKKNTSNILEWVFNCLAFIFKYLARTLTKDLIPTFEILSPYMLMAKKTYIGRFCAETLSFLLRKSKIESLNKSIQYCLSESRDSLTHNENYRESLLVLFTESIKSTNESLHSKSSLILSCLLQNVLENRDFTIEKTSLLSDILLEIIDHGNFESCKIIYSITIEYLNKALNISSHDQMLLSVAQVLSCLVFSGSGKKVTSWDTIMTTFRRLGDKVLAVAEEIDEDFKEILFDYISFSFSICIRNCEANVLSKNQAYFFELLMSCDNGKPFLGFVDSNLNINETKMINLGAFNHTQKFINKMRRENLQSVTYFASKHVEYFTRESNTLYIPEKVQNEVGNELNSMLSTMTDDEDFHDIYWRVSLLAAGGRNFNGWENLISLILFSGKNFKTSYMGQEIVSHVLEMISLNTKTSAQEEKVERVFSMLLSDLEDYRKSSSFINALKGLIESNNHLTDKVKDNSEYLLTTLSRNLSLPNHTNRHATINLLITVQKLSRQEPYPALLATKVIEEIPLSLSTGRDIILRVRNMAKEFSSREKPSDIEKIIVSRFLFGLLSNRFQPCWDAVYESVSLLLSHCSDILWEISYEFLVMDVNNYHNNSINDTRNDELEDSKHLSEIRDNRYREVFSSFNTCYKSYIKVKESIEKLVLERRGNNKYSEMMFEQVIKTLGLVPSVAEKNSRYLVPLALDDNEVETSEEKEIIKHKLSLRNRNNVLKIFVKFKNLKNVFRSEELFEHILVLLSNKNTDIQKLAFEILIKWNIKVLKKYRDRLSNLLDDTIFRDELTTLFLDNSESKIEQEDLDELVPFIMRILYGRVQGTPKSNSKAGKRLAILNSLPNLSDKHITEFVKLGYQKIDYKCFFDDQVIQDSDIKLLNKMNGFVSLLSDICDVLGYKHVLVLEKTVKPLIFCLAAAQRTVIGCGEDVLLEKVARNIRQIGMKCLGEIIGYLKEDFSWTGYIPIIYEYILQPRLVNFAEENLQQVSHLMRIMTMCVKQRNLETLMYMDDFAPIKSLMSVLRTFKAKDTVVKTILDFCVVSFNGVNTHVNDENFFTMLAIIVETLLSFLPYALEKSDSSETSATTIDLTLTIIRSEYVNEESAKTLLLKSLTSSLERPNSQVYDSDKTKVLLSLSSLIDNMDTSFDQIIHVYYACSKAFKIYSDVSIRESLCLLLKTIGFKFPEFETTSGIVEDLNAYSGKRMNEPDFERRLNAFRSVNEKLYSSLTPLQWIPILNCALFFINDDKELALRQNSSMILNRFVDAFSKRPNEEDAKPYISIFKDIVLPNIRLGLRNREEVIQSEYISVLSHTVEYSKFFTELDDMKVLITNDEDTNFFKNITHIQLHRRQRCIKRATEQRYKLSSNSTAHYILPILETYSICSDEKYRNITNEVLEAIKLFIGHVTWNHFKAVIKRYISQLNKCKEEDLKDMVNRLVFISKGFLSAIKDLQEGKHSLLKGLPPSIEIESFISKDLIPPITKILNHRNDETIVVRTPLAEALTYLILCSTEEFTESTLPGLLTNVCQVLRSRSEELRDAVRKTLAKVVLSLGPQYLNFILNELKSALSRGSQIHVLSYTVHFLLVTLTPICKLGDLNECATNIVNIMMEDIFGAAGEEKDAEGYTSKMKEVKFKKSFDSGELLSSNINLSLFGVIIHPIKLLLVENISLKTQNKIDELMRRYAMGLNHNEEASSELILQLCYELYKQSIDTSNFIEKKAEIKESEKHFMVELSKHKKKSNTDHSRYTSTLQKFGFDLLRTAISRHNNLLTVPNLKVFIPLLEQSLHYDDEGLIIVGLRVLNIVVKLPFPEDEDNIFKSCSRRAINIIKDCPSTNSELCQASLRFLATVVRHKPTLEFKDTAIAYVLVRIQPDLEEHNRQGLAFNFLKSVVAQHLVIPEVYDTMEKVSKIMVVNHAREIRDMARGIYFQFLMEFHQGRGKLEKQFKFLVNNLSYATIEGRQSVMELINSIIAKSSLDLLNKVASSFFVALSNITVNDESSKCREMATELIANILKRLGKDNFSTIEKYCFSWIEQSSNELLSRCGFNIYKIIISVFGIDQNEKLFSLVIENITRNLELSKKNEYNEQSISWQSVYSSLQLFSSVCSHLKEKAFDKKYEQIWFSVFECLLYPHSWVRLISCRLTHLLLTHSENAQFELTDIQIQSVASKLLRQLGAPSITEELGDQIVKNLVQIAFKWNSETTSYHDQHFMDNSDKNLEEDKLLTYDLAIDYLVSRICNIIRVEGRKVSSASKKSAIQLAAMLVQIIEAEKLNNIIEKVLFALYNYMEHDAISEQDIELKDLSTECTELMKQKIGTTSFLNIYSSVNQSVKSRREERRAKRVQLSVTAPDIAARRKLKKHERSREKRKHEKDSNGYYVDKKKMKRIN